MDVVRSAAREDVTDLLARDHCGCLPTDLSRSQPDRSSFGQIGLNLDMRQVGLQRGMRVLNPRDVADPLLDGLGLLLQLREVARKCAPRWTRCYRQHFLDASLR